MRPGENGELVLESTLEARVAAELLAIRGFGHVAEYFHPTIEQPQIGRLAFLARLAMETIGAGDNQEYTVADPYAAEVAENLIDLAISYKDPLPFSRYEYLRARMYGHRLIKQFNNKHEKS